MAGTFPMNSGEVDDAFVALVPDTPEESGMLLFWGEPMVCSSGRSGTASAVYGSSRELHICSLRIFNFSGRHMTFPTIDELRLKVSMGAETYPLHPLGTFASEFLHDRTLALLDNNYPDSGLPAGSYTRVYLACRITGFDPERHRPESLVLADGSRVPWARVKQDELDAFLKRPGADRLEEMIGKTSLVLGASHGTEE